MSYLLSQMFFCLIIAFLCGLVLGYLLCKIFCKCDKTDDSKDDKVASAPSTSVSSTSSVTAASTASSALAAVEDSISGASAETQDVVHAVAPVIATASEEEEDEIPTEITTLDSHVDLDGDGYTIETLEGIGPKTGTMFRDYGIATVGDYLRKLYTHESREQAAKDLEIRVKPLHEWASMSDLLRVKGIDHQYAELAFASGIKTVGELAKANATKLTEKMEATNKAGKQLIAPQAPSSDDVLNWVDVAKHMSVVVRIA